MGFICHLTYVALHAFSLVATATDLLHAESKAHSFHGHHLDPFSCCMSDAVKGPYVLSATIFYSVSV